MGRVGVVGDWKKGFVPVTIGGKEYFYDPETGWYDFGGETDFEIPLELDNGKFRFDAKGRKFVDEYGMALSIDRNMAMEEQVKKKYKLNCEVSFFRVEREGMPIYRF